MGDMSVLSDAVQAGIIDLFFHHVVSHEQGVSMKSSVQADRVSRTRLTRISHSPIGASEFSHLSSSAEQVRRRAYEIYEERCRTGGDGNAESDWIRAEFELNGAGRNVDRESIM
jgi:hypothetical protein